MSVHRLRRELSDRNLARAQGLRHEATWSATPAVIYDTLPGGGHGNFYPPSWRRLQRSPEWRQRLLKAYTAGQYVERRHDRRRAELECATSSDALLMNIFCCPGVLRRAALCRLLGIPPGERARFGVRMQARLAQQHQDRTEMDLVLGDLLIEAKLTESHFQSAPPVRVQRYLDLEEVFEVPSLPRSRAGDMLHYQLLRGILAAHASGNRFALFYDQRRQDLVQPWFQVLCAVRSAELRSRLQLLTWQEIAATLQRPLQRFLDEKYGIAADPALRR